MSHTTQLVLHLSSFDKPVVIKGKKINTGDLLVKTHIEEIDEFNLSKILKISPKSLEKYLKVKPQAKVKIGEIIAQKKGLLKKSIIKAPFEGTLIIVNKDQGIVGIKREIETKTPLHSWFTGEVADILPDKIIFKVNGLLISGKEGKGKPVTGKLRVLDHLMSLYQLPIDIKDNILVFKHAQSDIIAKADALGAKGIVAENLEQPPFSLPYILVDKLDDVKNYQQHEVVVFGDKKHLIVSNKDISVQVKK